MSDEEILIAARGKLAERTSFVPNRNAILDGAWDNGTLVQAEVKKIREKLK